MATPGRREDPPLERTLFEEPFRFDFFQAVRLLGRLRPDLAPVGLDGRAGREAVRFRTLPNLSFPASAIHRLEPSDDPEGPPAMTVAFLGLTGSMGVLPLVYSELNLERLRAGDRTLAAFLDLFHHRLISHFYRAWEKYHPHIGFERGANDKFSGHLLDLIGLGAEPLRDRHEFPDQALLFHAGAFAQRRRPAVVLESLLRDYFGLPVEVQQFVGQWLTLEPGDRSILGSSGPNNQLAVSFVLGGRVWDEQGKIRLRIGPLGLEDYLDLLPEGRSLRPVAQMARLFVDGELDIDVQLVLKAEEVPPCRLGSSGGGAQLGRLAWLRSEPAPTDVDDSVFAAD